MSILSFAEQEPVYFSIEFLTRILEARAFRIRTGPTILSSKVTSNASVEALGILADAGGEIDYDESAEFVRGLQVEFENLTIQRYEVSITNMDPQIVRLSASQAREEVGSARPGWYARMREYGGDSTDWIGPYGTGAEAQIALRETYGPWEMPDLPSQIVTFLGRIETCVRIASRPETLVNLFYFFGREMGFNRTFVKKTLREITHTPSEYMVLTAPRRVGRQR